MPSPAPTGATKRNATKTLNDAHTARHTPGVHAERTSVLGRVNLPASRDQRGEPTHEPRILACAGNDIALVSTGRQPLSHLWINSSVECVMTHQSARQKPPTEGGSRCHHQNENPPPTRTNHPQTLAYVPDVASTRTASRKRPDPIRTSVAPSPPPVPKHGTIRDKVRHSPINQVVFRTNLPQRTRRFMLPHHPPWSLTTGPRPLPFFLVTYASKV